MEKVLIKKKHIDKIHRAYLLYQYTKNAVKYSLEMTNKKRV